MEFLKKNKIIVVLFTSATLILVGCCAACYFFFYSLSDLNSGHKYPMPAAFKECFDAYYPKFKDQDQVLLQCDDEIYLLAKSRLPGIYVMQPQPFPGRLDGSAKQIYTYDDSINLYENIPYNAFLLEPKDRSSFTPNIKCIGVYYSNGKYMGKLQTYRYSKTQKPELDDASCRDFDYNSYEPNLKLK